MSINLPLVTNRVSTWDALKGKPYITVSAKGISNGQSTIINDGADFGPDTMLGATSKDQYGPPYTQTAGIQEAFAYAYGTHSPPAQLTVYLEPGGVYVLNTSVHFLSTEGNVWHDLVSTSRGAAAITAPAGSTFPFFVVDDGYTEDLQFRGLFFFPQTSSQSVLYSSSTSSQGDYHFEDCYFVTVGGIDIDLASINEFTMNQCFGAFTISIKSIKDFCHINNSVMNYTGNVLSGMDNGYFANISITNTEVDYAPQVGSSTTFLSVSYCNLSIDGLAINYPTNVLEVGTGTNYVKLSRISATNSPVSSYTLLSSQPTYLEIDDSLTQPNTFADYPYYPNSTTNGTTSGTVKMVLLKNTPLYKKYMITFLSYENDTSTDQTIDFPLPFSSLIGPASNNTNLTIGYANSYIIITTPNNTTTYSGIVIVEGY